MSAAHCKNLHLFDVSETWTESFAYVRGLKKKLKTIRNINITVCHFEWRACWHQGWPFHSVTYSRYAVNLSLTSSLSIFVILSSPVIICKDSRGPHEVLIVPTLAGYWAQYQLRCLALTVHIVYYKVWNRYQWQTILVFNVKLLMDWRVCFKWDYFYYTPQCCILIHLGWMMSHYFKHSETQKRCCFSNKQTSKHQHRFVCMCAPGLPQIPICQ